MVTTDVARSVYFILYVPLVPVQKNSMVVPVHVADKLVGVDGIVSSSSAKAYALEPNRMVIDKTKMRNDLFKKKVREDINSILKRAFF